jgi:predicted RNA binding protein with dsRBD fold (UPF0201 family)
MENVDLHVEAEINPTESREKVEQAIKNMFGELTTQTRPLRRANLLIAEATGKESLAHLGELLRRERIRSAARAVFMEGLDKRTIHFCLNKQVAYAGHISFSKEEGESPLGPIRVTITCENPRELVDWLAPRIATRG